VTAILLIAVKILVTMLTNSANKGYHRINQLTGDHISVEKLSDWLGIGKGTVDLLIQYVEEDVELVKASTFTMDG
jgi:hypothetical protein